MTITTPDAQLVAGHLAGDPAALAGIYDRYADSLYDTAAAMLRNRDDAADVMQDVFVIASSKLGQLRDPARLKPWMFAILRNEVYRRTKQRSRTVATDFSNDDLAAASGFDMTDERGLDADSEAAESTELAALVRDASGGLDERDQLVLELSVRQGLEGQDLADALGVSANQSYTLVHRMRDRVEKSLGAFCVARAGRKDCDELDGILGNWDGEFTVLVRKRVARHIERCETCSDSRRKIAPIALFAGAPAFAAPAALRDRVLDAVRLQAAPVGGTTGPTAGVGRLDGPGGQKLPYGFEATGGFPSVLSAGRKLAAWVAPTAAASMLLVVAGMGLWFIGSDTEPGTFQTAIETSAPAPISTTEPATSVAASSTSVRETTPESTPPTNTVPPSTLPVSTPPPTTVPPTEPPAVVDPPPATDPAPPQTDPPTAQPPAAPTPVTPAPQPPAPQPPAPNPPAPNPPATDPPAPNPPAPPPTPGQLTGSTGTIDLGNNASASFSLSNPGGTPVAWTASNAAPLNLSVTSGTVAPGSTTPITISLDRANLAEGAISVTITFTGDGGQSVDLTVRALINRPPVITNIGGPDIVCIRYNFGASPLTLWEATISASITDESGGNATFTVNGPGGRSGSGSSPISQQWAITVNNGNGDAIQQTATGTWNWTITATDTRGNSATTSGSTSVTCN